MCLRVSEPRGSPFHTDRADSKPRLFAGEDSDGPTTPSTPSSVYLRVNRRRTDLMPTIPSPRDGPPSTARSSSAKAFTRSPGRTYSMSRLDQLAQPRKRATEQLSTLTERQQSQPLSASSMSRSMSHLAASGNKSLKRSDNSRSMGTLPGAVPVPRPTRAERLRRKAREYQQQQQQGKNACCALNSGLVHSNQASVHSKIVSTLVVLLTMNRQLLSYPLFWRESRDFSNLVDNYKCND